MQIYLPIAEMVVQAETVAILGAIVGVISGVFGIGGGFLTTPFLIFMGVPPGVAVGTQASQLVASSSTAVVGHWKKRNIDLKMSGVLLAGGLIGTILGVLIFRLLQYFGQVDTTISILYVLFLCSVGGMMLWESTMTLIEMKRQEKFTADDTQQTSIVEKKSRYQEFRDNLPYKMNFPDSKIYISVIIPLSIGTVGGLMVSVLGIGAGFLLVPAMIYLLRMPPLLVAGTSLIQILITSALACVLHAVTNQSVDLILAIILIAGSVIGAQIGVRLSKYIRGATARFILAFIITAVGIRLCAELLLAPETLYNIMVQ